MGHLALQLSALLAQVGRQRQLGGLGLLGLEVLKEGLRLADQRGLRISALHPLRHAMPPLDQSEALPGRQAYMLAVSRAQKAR